MQPQHKVILLKLGLAAICLLPGRSIAQSTPPNDNFANRTVLTGSSISIASTLAGATLESAEINGLVPQPGGQSTGGSVWWTWTAPQSSTVVIFVQRDFSSVSGSNTYLGVYSGSALTNLTEITYTTFDAPRGRYATFPATAGATFQIRVAGSWNQAFNLLLTATNPPVFVVQPTDCLVSPHGSAFFGAIASGPIPIFATAAAAYQWKFNGTPIPGQTCPSLLVHDVSTNQVGNYSVVASNAGGVTESASVMLSLVNTNPVPRLTVLPPANSTNVPFALSGESGRWYAIESCSNLLNWGTDHANKIWSTNTVWLQATNASGLLSVPRLGPAHFVRASLNVPTDVCVGQLKQMVWAEHVFAIENQLARSSSVTFQDLKPYVPLGPFGNIQVCPEGGAYVAPPTVIDPITCSVTSRGHTLGVSP
jgi:hypothetical protein